MTDPRALFHPDVDGVRAGVEALLSAAAAEGRPHVDPGAPLDLPDAWPETGADPRTVLATLASPALEGVTRLAHPGFFAHMDPPTPWPTWVTAAWAAAFNQNLLHPEVAPLARQVEARVVEWLLEPFGMAAGHLVPGSSLANLTALWAARERTGARRVVASAASHLSVKKAADILGLAYVAVPVDAAQRLDASALPPDLDDAILVLTAGTTITGSIDPLDAGQGAAWRHVDAAWSGPMILSPRQAHQLAGIERADSVVVSAHKWLFQPKESALVAFADPASQEVVTYGGPYLAAPNVGLQGSHGSAAALALAATLLTLGREGVAELIELTMDAADRLAALIGDEPALELWGEPASGIVVWRPVGADPDAARARLTDAWVSVSTLEGERWLRSVAANPWADPDLVVRAVLAASASA